MSLLRHLHLIAITNSTIAEYTTETSQASRIDCTRRHSFLKREPENIYDCNAILVTAEDGYVLGYIPKEQNCLCPRQWIKGESLYAILMDYLSEKREKTNYTD